MKHLLYRAVEAEIGVEVETNNRKLLRQRLYKFMKDDPAFATLSIVFPSDESKLWILKRTSEDAA